ncbi:MAG TPA: hypothetical protein DCL44_02830 [Elusimicrobia bacterium]|nr:hypothetical protein [Elusimicrobiota bacterium]
MKIKYFIYPALLVISSVVLSAQTKDGSAAPSRFAAGDIGGAVRQLKNLTPGIAPKPEAKITGGLAAPRLIEKDRSAKTKSLAGQARPDRSVVELEFPEYCRINDKDLNALTEDIMTRESPRDPLYNNLFIQLEAATPAGKTIRAKVINVRHGHPGDQFHIEVFVAGKLLFKSGRQDNPIFIGFQVDDVPYSLTCFEDIQ